jgi:hypothetical protein
MLTYDKKIDIIRQNCALKIYRVFLQSSHNGSHSSFLYGFYSLNLYGFYLLTLITV